MDNDYTKSDSQDSEPPKITPSEKKTANKIIAEYGGEIPYPEVENDGAKVNQTLASTDSPPVKPPKHQYYRAAENAGITDEQIAALQSAEELEKLLDEAEQNNKYIRAKPKKVTDDFIDLCSRPNALLPGIASHRTALLAAEPGIGKSAIALTMCAAVATGQNIAGFEPVTSLARTALFISLEEETAEIALRAAAIKQRYGIDYKSNLFVAGANDVEFLTTDNTIGTFSQHGEQELRDLIYEYDAEFVVLDPLSVFPIGEENNTNHAAFFQTLNRICSELFCTILVIHHIRKPPAGFVVRTSLNDVRGSSTIVGTVRSAMIVNKSADYITMTYAKVQYENPPPDLHFARSHELIKTSLGEFDTIVLTPHEVLKQLSTEELQQYVDVLIRLFDERESYAKHSRNADWLGNAIALKMKIDIGSDKPNNDSRSKEQLDNRNKLTKVITILEQAELIEGSNEEKEYTNSRKQRSVPIYVPGNALHSE